MDIKLTTEIINVIRMESQRRSEQLKDEDPEVAYDQGLFTDGPFINEMCLMVLVALNHQVERELVFLAARANAGATLTSEQYQANVRKWHKTWKKNRDQVVEALKLDFGEWEKSIKTLRLVANCYKHDDSQKPNDVLCKHLNLKTVDELTKQDSLTRGYLPLPESNMFKEGLAVSVGLPENTDYCAIVDTFAELVNQFLKQVREKTSIARITGRKITFAG